jgi:simple sugar transport system substrate-binding protein
VVTTPLGAISFVDERTIGFEETFQGTSVHSEVPLSDLGDSIRIKSIMETELQKDESIDCVFSVGGAFIAAMLEARIDLGERGEAMHWGTIDTSEAAYDALQTGALDYALDAQQYSQGYFPVVILNLYLRQAIQPATKVFLTGPAVITPDNVDALIAAKTE